MKYVTFEEAKILKKLGYPQEDDFCFVVENSINLGEAFKSKLKIKEGREFISCPTYFDVWKWLWDEKKYKLEICAVSDCEVIGYSEIDSRPSLRIMRDESRKDLEDILENAINTTLKKIKLI